MLNTADVPPHNTVYVSNINTKIKKAELRTNLYLAFGQFGTIIEVHAQGSFKLRGQAWVVFDKVAAATRAVKHLQGFMFFGKPLRCAFAEAKSDVIAKQEGVYRPRPKRVEGKTTEKKSTRPAMAPAPETKVTVTEDEEVEEKEDATMAEEEDQNPPNKILFVENLPETFTSMMLAVLFQQYDGYVEARLIQGKAGIAFVEYGDDVQAGNAKDTLQGFKVTPTNAMKISYAKK